VATWIRVFRRGHPRVTPNPFFNFPYLDESIRARYLRISRKKEVNQRKTAKPVHAISNLFKVAKTGEKQVTNKKKTTSKERNKQEKKQRHKERYNSAKNKENQYKTNSKKHKK
jgi:hypothetical protein